MRCSVPEVVKENALSDKEKCRMIPAPPAPCSYAKYRAWCAEHKPIGRPPGRKKSSALLTSTGGSGDEDDKPHQLDGKDIDMSAVTPVTPVTPSETPTIPLTGEEEKEEEKEKEKEKEEETKTKKKKKKKATEKKATEGKQLTLLDLPGAVIVDDKQIVLINMMKVLLLLLLQ